MYDGGKEDSEEGKDDRSGKQEGSDLDVEESMWEVSDFSSSDESFDEWLP